MKKLLFFSICSFLSACASPEQQKAYVTSLSDRELCMTYMTSVSMNQYQDARYAEIRQRRLDCWQYGNVAEEQSKAQRRFDDATRRASGESVGQTTETQLPKTKMVNPNACIQDGGGVYCPNHPKTRLVQP
jgi:hypothetical protein